MNKIFLKKILLSVLIVSIVSFGLTGCLFSNSEPGPGEDEFSAVTIHLSSTFSDHHYNIYVDNELKASDVTVGVKFLGYFHFGQHVFTVIHHKGVNFGSASQTVSILENEKDTDVYFNITF